MATADDCEAASSAVGWDVSASEVDAALIPWTNYALDPMREVLAEYENEFEHRHFRGVELADKIDKLRIAIAVRESREADG